MKSILFVDDEPNILQGLQRMLRPMHREWDMVFVEGGHEALNLMEGRAFDIIVSDMRMPGMDGAALLTRVMELYPQTVRLALSGQSDKETIFRSVGPTHQFLAKPCDAQTLKSTVDRAFALRDLLGNEAVKRLVSQLGALPVLPDVYSRLMAELQSPDSSLVGVARIIESDVSMTAKILQYANSAFFGVRQNVSSAFQAVNMLGLEIIRSLVLMAGVFSQTSEKPLADNFSLDAFAQHSLRVGTCVRAIGKYMKCDEREMGDAFTAGVLHDLGELLLASSCPDAYAQTRERARAEPVSVEDAEMEAIGATHAEVGGYLVGLWGFRDPIVEAIAFHRRPSRCPSRVFSPLTAVHAADVFANEQAPPGYVVPTELHEPYLRECGLEAQVVEWREVCRATAEGESR